MHDPTRLQTPLGQRLLCLGLHIVDFFISLLIGFLNAWKKAFKKVKIILRVCLCNPKYPKYDHLSSYYNIFSGLFYRAFFPQVFEIQCVFYTYSMAPISPVTFQVLQSHMWLMATILNSVDGDLIHFAISLLFAVVEGHFPPIHPFTFLSMQPIAPHSPASPPSSSFWSRFLFFFL